MTIELKKNKAEENKLKQVAQERYETIKNLDKDPFLGYSKMEEAYQDYKVTSNVEVLGRMLNKENLFISGPAGSGKTTIINKFMKIVDAESDGTVNIALTASTGIAAQLIGGRTIHSWSGLGIMTEEFNKKKLPKYVFSRLQDLRTVDVLIIDEISMLPAYFFSNLNKLLKWAKRNDKAFGGVQLILTGDFQQLPPVNKDKNIDNGFAINTSDWEEANFNYCYMDKLHRATDKKLRYVLETISRDKVNEKTRALINSRMEGNATLDKDKVYTTLYTTNKNVDKYNQEKLDSLPTPSVYINAHEIGQKKKIEKIYKDNNLKKSIELKKDAVVMLTFNFSSELPNGSIGKVIGFDSNNNPRVKFNSGEIITIYRKEYNLEETKTSYTIDAVTSNTKEIKYKEIVATVLQIPLKCAWAITVHKSQGQLFDSVKTDLSNCFASGIGYVALSRVRSLDDLLITGFSEKAYNIDKNARNITNFVKKRSIEGRKEFKKNEEEYTSLLQYSLMRQMNWGNKDKSI